MAQKDKSIVSKRAKIDKANATILTFIAVASFVVVFSLVSIRYLINQFSYQVRVQSAQHKSLVQLKADKQAALGLVKSYETFNGETTNIIGGSSSQQGGQNGDNAKIVLDALPGSYDFPALITSVTAIINQTGASIVSISGNDVGPGTTSGSASSAATPTATTVSSAAPVAMPFSFSVQGAYPLLQQVITKLQQSIRPIQIQSVNFSGTDQNLDMTVTAESFYLPASGFNVSTETIQ